MSFKEGDFVYSKTYGMGVVVGLSNSSFWPICVKHESGAYIDYTVDGICYGRPDPKYDLTHQVEYDTQFVGIPIEPSINPGRTFNDSINKIQAEPILEKHFSKLDTGANKDLSGKLPLDLVAPEMINSLAEGLDAGIKKGYDRRNWEKGIPLTKSYAAAMRHMLKWASGIDIDEETGVHHLKLALINIGMACTQITRGRTDLDDRGK